MFVGKCHILGHTLFLRWLAFCSDVQNFLWEIKWIPHLEIDVHFFKLVIFHVKMIFTQLKQHEVKSSLMNCSS